MFPFKNISSFFLLTIYVDGVDGWQSVAKWVLGIVTHVVKYVFVDVKYPCLKYPKDTLYICICIKYIYFFDLLRFLLFIDILQCYIIWRCCSINNLLKWEAGSGGDVFIWYKDSCHFQDVYFFLSTHWVFSFFPRGWCFKGYDFEKDTYNGEYLKWSTNWKHFLNSLNRAT